MQRRIGDGEGKFEVHNYRGYWNKSEKKEKLIEKEHVEYETILLTRMDKILYFITGVLDANSEGLWDVG